MALGFKFESYSGWQENHTNCEVKTVGVSCNDPRNHFHFKMVTTCSEMGQFEDDYMEAYSMKTQSQWCFHPSPTHMTNFIK